MSTTKQPRSDREVRDQLVHQGVETLSEVELLSILLREGTPHRSAIELAEALYESFGKNLAEIGRASLDDLRKREGLGTSRAAQLSAALELGRRLRAQESTLKETIHTTRDVVEIFEPLLAHLPHEELWAIYLNGANRILDRVRISQGGVAKMSVDYRLIIKRALERLAQGIILVHNHPSGSPKPSPEDELLTEKVCRAASLFEIVLADHVIIGHEGEYSFRNEGFFESDTCCSQK